MTTPRTKSTTESPHQRIRRLRLWRKGVGYLRPMGKHLVAMAIAGLTLGILLVPVGILLTDVLWTRILLGDPLTTEQAQLLGLPLNPFSTAETLDRAQRHVVLQHWLWAAGIAFAITLPLGLGLFYYRLWVLQKINQSLRLDILDRLQSLSLKFHRDQAAGQSIYRVNQDAATISRFLDSLVLAPVGAIYSFIFGLAVISLFDPWFTSLLIALWIPLLVISWWRSGLLQRELREARAASARVTTRAQELVAALPVVRACGSETWDAARFAEESQKSFAVAHRARSHLVSYEVGIFCVVGLALVWAIALGAMNVHQDAPTAASVLGIQVWTVGVWTYFRSRFAGSASQAQQLFVGWGRAQDVFAGLGRVFELLDRSPDLVDSAAAVDLPPPTQGIRFRSVTFAYNEERPALQDLDFYVPVGGVTAIVGPSGSGKSTLLSLLLRLIDPDDGTVEIDGTPLTKIRRASLRQNVSVALQEPLLFGGTIADNIRWAAPTASDEAMVEAAKVACAHEFIEGLPQGYQTTLGERGTKLSTGQRQRLSLARAILKNPNILLLDEPTSSLDADTEARLLENLTHWGKHRTLFIVTHRPQTAALASQRIALDRGRRIESSEPEGAKPS